MKALLGRKIGMSQVVKDDGTVVPVTLVQAGPCTITQVKSIDTDGYDAVQLGYGQAKHTAKPQSGHFKAAKTNPVIIREFRGVEFDKDATKVGSSFNVDVFEIGDKVHVSGRTKGKGYAGTVKRWNFNTSKKTHGGNGNVRKSGSIGGMYPQKVFKGKKMSGQMGYVNQTTKNLEVAYVDAEKNVIGIRGAVPGPRKSYVTIKGVTS